MLICDLCGNNNHVHNYGILFEIKEKNKESIGTSYSGDVCDFCYTKLNNMIHVYNSSPPLHKVLAKGLDCKQIVTRGD